MWAGPPKERAAASGKVPTKSDARYREATAGRPPPAARMGLNHEGVVHPKIGLAPMHSWALPILAWLHVGCFCGGLLDLAGRCQVVCHAVN